MLKAGVAMLGVQEVIVVASRTPPELRWGFRWRSNGTNRGRYRVCKSGGSLVESQAFEFTLSAG